MKRLFFFTLINFDNWETDGICKKIIAQVNAFREKGYTVELTYLLNMDTYLDIDGEKICLGKRKGLINKGTACIYMLNYIKEKNYDAVYIRYGFAERHFYRLLKEFRKKTNRLVIEIPTFPYDKEFLTRFDLRVALFLDKCYRNRLKKYVSRIVTFSKDKTIFGIPTIRTINGIDFDNISIRHVNRYEMDNGIQMIAVASMSKWHGYDRLIKGLGKYYQNSGIRKIILHMVGEGEEIPEYKKLVRKYNLEEKVIFYGMKFGEELDRIYDQCNIAVASLGMHRLGLYLASTLKSREYAAKGLPIITSTEIDIFPSDQFSFICKCDEDESYININQIIDFFDQIYNEADGIQIADNIRKIAGEICNMSVTMQPVVDFFES